MKLFCWAIVIWATVEILASLLDFPDRPLTAWIHCHQGDPGSGAWALLGLSAQTFAEEFIFRGYLTRGDFLSRPKVPLAAALISGFLFGAMHVPNGAPQAVSAACFGIATSLIAVRTGGIAFTFGLHLTNNLFGAVVLVSADDVFLGSPGLISQNTLHGRTLR